MPYRSKRTVCGEDERSIQAHLPKIPTGMTKVLPDVKLSQEEMNRMRLYRRMFMVDAQTTEILEKFPSPQLPKLEASLPGGDQLQNPNRAGTNGS